MLLAKLARDPSDCNMLHSRRYTVLMVNGDMVYSETAEVEVTLGEL
jgi:hypothetical protein